MDLIKQTLNHISKSKVVFFVNSLKCQLTNVDKHKSTTNLYNNEQNISKKKKTNYFIFTNSKPNVEMVRQTFANSWAAIWNSLPHDIKKMPHLLKQLNPDALKSFLV